MQTGLRVTQTLFKYENMNTYIKFTHGSVEVGDVIQISGSTSNMFTGKYKVTETNINCYSNLERYCEASRIKENTDTKKYTSKFIASHKKVW